MTDVVRVALISSSFPAAVAVIAAIASVFGPAWHDRVQRRAQAKRGLEELRYKCAGDYVDLLTETAGCTTESPQGRAAQRARMKFVATLRAGEGPLEDFTDKMRSANLDLLNAAGDQLFGWLRGDIDIKEMTWAKLEAQQL